MSSLSPVGDNEAGRALIAGRAAGVDGRHQIGALDAVLRARRFDVQRGDAQVAIVGERPRDESLQLGVGEEFLPADFCGRDGRRRRCVDALS